IGSGRRCTTFPPRYAGARPAPSSQADPDRGAARTLPHTPRNGEQMATVNEQVIRGAYDAFARGDIPGVLATLHPDIDWHVTDALPQGGDAHGHDEVAGFFGRLAGIWDSLEIVTDAFVASDDRVVVVGEGRGKIDGADAAYGFAHSWTFGDELAVR